MRKILFTGLAVALLAVMVIPASADDPSPPSGAGQYASQTGSPPEAPPNVAMTNNETPGFGSDVGASYYIWHWGNLYRYLANRRYVCGEGYTSGSSWIHWAATHEYLCRYLYGSWSCTSWASRSGYNVHYQAVWHCWNDARWLWWYSRSVHQFRFYSGGALYSRDHTFKLAL